MTDPHEAFADWVLDGAPDEPARVVAVHASACEACQAMIEAFDGLARIDLDAAPAWVPSGDARNVPATISVMIARRSAAAVAVVLLVGAAAFAIRGVPLAGSEPSPPAGALEGVLGGQVSPTATPTPSPTGSVQPTPSPSATATLAPTPAPPIVTPPPQADVTPRPATSRPSIAATPAPTSVATPIPTPQPTAAPTLPPTPVPTPEATPIPDDCEDGIDNDGDLLVDLADPGCLLDGNEPSA
jgi:hypothetical protein